MSDTNFFLSMLFSHTNALSAQMHFISANERGPRNRFALKRSKVPAGRTIYFRLSKLEQRSVLHPVFIIQRSRGAHSAMHRADSRQIRYLDIESLSRAQRETRKMPKLIYRISMSLRAERRVASRCVALCANTFP